MDPGLGSLRAFQIFVFLFLFVFPDRIENEFGADSKNCPQWFCSLQGNEYFTEIAEEFIQDDFNLTGLGSQVISIARKGFR